MKYAVAAYVAFRVGMTVFLLPPGHLVGILGSAEHKILAGVHLAFATLDFLVLLFVASKIGSGSAVRNAAKVLANIAIVVCFFQFVCWVVLAYDLAGQDGLTQQLYRDVFGGGNANELKGHKLALFYQPHHSLNYAIKPNLKSRADRINTTFKIRRQEPIREITQVKWRALALGGSTTFAAGREEDTWVYLTEENIRKENGQNYDVINGGISGYNIQDNFIHYVALLSHLDPDTVIIYQGINDVEPRLFGTIEYDYSNYRMRWNGDVIPPAQDNLSWCFPYKYWYYRKYIKYSNTLYMAKVTCKPWPDPSTWAQALEKNDSRVFRKNLENFITLLKAQGRTVVVVPQYYIPRTDSEKVFYEGVKQHNDVCQQVAKELKVHFVAEVLNPNVFAAADISDACHFTESGNKKMAQVVETYLQEHHVIVPR